MLVLLGLLVFIGSFASKFYFSMGVEPSATIEFLYQGAFLCGVIWWLKHDPRKSAVEPVYCRGLMVGIGWFFMIPYHLIQTRGARGLIPILALIASFFTGYMLAILVYVVL